MSKVKDLSMAIDELHQCGEALIGVAETLKGLFGSTDDVSAPESEPAPDTKSITLEEVRAVLAQKSMGGHTAEIQALIHKFGADKLSQVDPAQYASLMAEAEAL